MFRTRWNASLPGSGVTSGISTATSLPPHARPGVLRTDIAELRGANVSLMPEGLEAGVSQQDMADLIQLLRFGGAPGRGRF